MTEKRSAGLHRAFAQLVRGGEAQFERKVVEFANRYGLLGDENIGAFLDSSSDPPCERRVIVWGETLDGWRRRALEAAALVSVWDLVHGEAGEELSKYFYWNGRPALLQLRLGFDAGRLVTDSRGAEWHTERAEVGHMRRGKDGEAVRETWDVEGEVIAAEFEDVGRYRFATFSQLRGPRFDPVFAARLWLYDRINACLADHAALAMYAEQDPPAALLGAPRSLLGAIYLHFAREMAGRTLAVECAYRGCGNIFVASGKRKYCSNRCRSADSYHRKKGADRFSL